jgi:soluble lytic murein transglycosylase-like protein
MIPTFTTVEARLELTSKWAARYGLDARMVCAVIEQESNWNAGAVRFEPAFLAHYIAALNLPLLESLDRSTSWGLMQIMGQVAIENGFTGNLPDLRDPDTGVDFGCRKLQKCFQVHGADEAGLLAYNGGGNPDYGKQVLARISHYSEG